MKKSAIYELIIEAVIESQKMDTISKIDALDLLFDNRNLELWKENNEGGATA